jgi:putative transposase
MAGWISDARKAKKEESGKLKKLLAESMLDVSTLKKMLGKNF